MGVCLVLVQRKTTRQYHWVVLTMNRSHRYFFEPYPIWFGTNFPFRPLEMSNSCYGVPLSNGDRRSPWKLSCMFSQALKNLWKSLIALCASELLWFTLIHSEHSGLFLNKGFQALLWNNYESPKEQSIRNSNRTFRLTRRTDQWEFRCSVFTVLQLSVSVQTSWLNRHVFHVHSWSQTLKTYHTLILVITVDLF